MMRLIYTFWIALPIIGIIGFSCSSDNETTIDLSDATILISPEIQAPLNKTIETVLIEEIDKRTGNQLKLDNNWENETVIAVVLSGDKELYGKAISGRSDKTNKKY